jgi:hypothetical protein
MVKYLAQNWGLVAVIAVLVSAVAALQVEVVDLQGKIAAALSRDSSTAAQVAKFERDFFARLNAEQIARANAVTKAQAQQNAAVKEELKALPMGVFGTPVPFPTATPP